MQQKTKKEKERKKIQIINILCQQGVESQCSCQIKFTNIYIKKEFIRHIHKSREHSFTSSELNLVYHPNCCSPATKGLENLYLYMYIFIHMPTCGWGCTKLTVQKQKAHSGDVWMEWWSEEADGGKQQRGDVRPQTEADAWNEPSFIRPTDFGFKTQKLEPFSESLYQQGEATAAGSFSVPLNGFRCFKIRRRRFSPSSGGGTRVKY